MSSVHVLVNKNYWLELRSSMHPEKSTTLRVKIQRGRVLTQEQDIEEMKADLMAVYLRKFISGGDEVYLKNIFKSIEELKITGAHLKEAEKAWKAVADPILNFYTFQDATVGCLMPPYKGDIWWEEETPNKSTLQLETFSAREFTEILYNEEMLHPKVTNRNVRLRNVLRSTPLLYRRFITNAAVGACMYAVILLHNTIRHARPHLCPAGCPERQIIDRNAAEIDRIKSMTAAKKQSIAAKVCLETNLNS